MTPQHVLPPSLPRAMKGVVCSACHGPLSYIDQPPTAICKSCHGRWNGEAGLWDFRVLADDVPSGWDAEQFDRCYRAVNGFVDSYGHARRSGIPDFVETYRLAALKDRVAKRIVAARPNRLLDIGCGNGWYDMRLRERWGFAGEVFGVDVSRVQIATYLQELKHRKLSGLFPHCGNAEKLPFSDGYFDAVVITEALEHVAHPERALQECSRVLRNDGKAFVTTPAAGVCHFWISLFRPAQIVKRLFVPSRTDPTLQIYDRPLRFSTIKRCLREAGLEIMDHRQVIFLPHESYLQFIPSLALKALVGLARCLERAQPFSTPLGLHHVFEVRRSNRSIRQPTIRNQQSAIQNSPKFQESDPPSRRTDSVHGTET